MKFKKQAEPVQHSDQKGIRWLHTIRTIRDLKLWRVLLILILLTGICYIMSIWSSKPNFPLPSWILYIPWTSLASTGLGVVIIGFIYEWLIRNETKQELDEMLNQHFLEQAQTIKNDIPESILTTPEIMQKTLAPHVVDQIIRNSLQIGLSDVQLAQEAYDSFLSHLLNHEERRKNYRCNIYLTNVQSHNIPAATAQKYYDGTIDVHYATTLQKSTFSFICVPTSEEYEDLLKDPTWELRWIAEPTKDYPSEIAFQVEVVHVNGHKLQVKTEIANGRTVVTATHPELQSMQGQQVMVYYRYKVKIKKRGHLLMIHVSCPTHNVVVDLYYARTDIYFVNVLNFFASKTKPNVRYLPTRKKSEKIEVEVNDWVFPKGGVVFVWVLRAERHPGFWKLTTDPRRPGRFPSKPDSRVTNPLPPIILELDNQKDDPNESSS